MSYIKIIEKSRRYGLKQELLWQMNNTDKYVVDGHYGNSEQKQRQTSSAPQPTDAVSGSGGRVCNSGSLCLGGIEGIKQSLEKASFSEGINLLNKAAREYGDVGFQLIKAHSKNPESPWKAHCSLIIAFREWIPPLKESAEQFSNSISKTLTTALPAFQSFTSSAANFSQLMQGRKQLSKPKKRNKRRKHNG